MPHALLLCVECLFLDCLDIFSGHSHISMLLNYTVEKVVTCVGSHASFIANFKHVALSIDAFSST